MARLRPVLKALATAGNRERKTFGSIASNNFFLMTLLFIGQAGAFLYLAGVLVVLFPLSADPIRKIPAERMALWPLNRGNRTALRAITPWLNPITWLLAALAAWSVKHTESVSLFFAAVALFATGFLLPSFSGEPRFLRWVPAAAGPLGQLVRKNMREMLLTLDFYLALTLSISGVAYRLFVPRLPGDALMMMTLLIVLALSSYAQCLFGLESKGGLTRYRVLPLSGWRILLAKDIAFMTAATLLTLPLAPLSGLAAALAALSIGHAGSVGELREQTRWRFSSGASFGNGMLQTVALAGAGVTAYRISLLILIPCSFVYAGSLWWFGRSYLPAAGNDA